LVEKKTVHKTRVLWRRWLINQLKSGVAVDEDLLPATFSPAFPTLHSKPSAATLNLECVQPGGATNILTSISSVTHFQFLLKSKYKTGDIETRLKLMYNSYLSFHILSASFVIDFEIEQYAN
jgi:hypothetical protein